VRFADEGDAAEELFCGVGRVGRGLVHVAEAMFALVGGVSGLLCTNRDVESLTIFSSIVPIWLFTAS
jgi:hypothetical protein